MLNASQSTTDYGTPRAQVRHRTSRWTIDGIDASRCPAGTSVMRAAVERRREGAQAVRHRQRWNRSAPAACAWSRSKARSGYPASCTTPAEAGMKVRTQTPKLAELRRGVMELYISDHPLDCLTCAANGNCELQDMAGVSRPARSALRLRRARTT